MTDFPVTPADEIWKPIPGFEGLYEASSLGRIRSLARTVVYRKRVKAGMAEIARDRPAKYLTPSPNGHYLKVSLWRDGARSFHLVHALVCAAFHGARPPLHDAAHRDGNSSNNAQTNLYWATRKENIADCKKHGTFAEGQRHGQAKLSAKQVLLARAGSDLGLSVAAMARYFSVNSSTLYNAVVGQTWRCLPAQDALIASEQAEQLIALQKWVRETAAIDVNGVP